MDESYLDKNVNVSNIDVNYNNKEDIYKLISSSQKENLMNNYAYRNTLKKIIESDMKIKNEEMRKIIERNIKKQRKMVNNIRLLEKHKNEENEENKENRKNRIKIINDYKIKMENERLNRIRNNIKKKMPEIKKQREAKILKEKEELENKINLENQRKNYIEEKIEQDKFNRMKKRAQQLETLMNMKDKIEQDIIRIKKEQKEVKKEDVVDDSNTNTNTNTNIIEQLKNDFDESKNLHHDKSKNAPLHNTVTRTNSQCKNTKKKKEDHSKMLQAKLVTKSNENEYMSPIRKDNENSNTKDSTKAINLVSNDKENTDTNHSNNNNQINNNHVTINTDNNNINTDTINNTELDSNNKKDNIKVFVRFRPFNEVEKKLQSEGIGKLSVEYMYKEPDTANKQSDYIVGVKTISQSGIISNPYYFDRIFDTETSQLQLYNSIGKELIKNIINGYNGTLFAYGQSGSGKTYTMYGSNIYDEENKGIMPRLISDIFDYVQNSDENIVFQIKMSVLQIYKEVIYDLLTNESNLKIKESPEKGIYVENLSEVYISSFEEFMEFTDLAQENRIVSETGLNSTSSRSHSIMIFQLKQKNMLDKYTKIGKLNLVDLAGSEKISKTGAIGETLEEAKKINLSLSALGNVIHSLCLKKEHIPYRDSKLTRILQESLGGNFKTSLVVTCSAHSYNMDETISSLQFGARAKTVKTKAKINLKLSYDELQKMIVKLKAELALSKKEILRLKRLLENNNIDNNDNHNDNHNDIHNDNHNDNNGNTEIHIKKRSLTQKREVSSSSDDESKHSFSNGLKLSHKKKDSLSSEITEDNKDKNKDVHNLDKTELIKLIEELKEKNENLNTEIRQKDSVISRLEESKKELNDKYINSQSFKLDDDKKDNKINKDSTTLYNDILDTLKLIQNTQSDLKNHELDMTLFNNSVNNNINDLFSYINKIFNTDNDNTIVSNFNKYINNLISELSSVFKNTEADIFEISTKFDNYKNNLTYILDNISNVFKSKKKNNLQINYLRTILFFIFNYLESLINVNLTTQLNFKLNKENHCLSTINDKLLLITKNLLQSNINLMQNNRTLKKRGSVIVSKYPNGVLTENTNVPDKKINIVNCITKKATNIRKTVQIKNVMEFKKILNTFQNNDIKDNKRDLYKADVIPEEPDTTNTNNNTINNNITNSIANTNITNNTNSNTNTIIGNDFEQRKALFLLSNPPKNNISLPDLISIQSNIRNIEDYITKFYIKDKEFINEQETLKKYLLKMIKESELEVLKKLANSKIITHIELNSFKEENKKILNEQFDVIQDNNKLQHKTQKQKSDLDYTKKLKANRHSVISSNTSYSKLFSSDDSSSTSRINTNNNKDNKDINSKDINININNNINNSNAVFRRKNRDFNKIDNTEKPTDNLNLNNSFPLLSNKNEEPFINRETAYENHYTNSSNMNLRKKEFNIKKQELLQKLIDDYIKSGSATRKFDGIDVSVENDEIKYIIKSGLTAQHSIKYTPVSRQISPSYGDMESQPRLDSMTKDSIFKLNK